jgi:uncharacterized SAM-binding protein YcdF (DUF218 family)
MFFELSKIVWFFATPSNALAFLVLLGLLLALSARRRRAGLALAWLGLAGLMLAGFSPLGRMLVLPLEERFPAYRDDGAPIAGVVVLGGAVQVPETAARGQLMLNEAAERVVALADLARRHPQARIVFTGGSGALIENEGPEADALAAHLGTLGIARERVLFENRSRNTFENAVFSRDLVEPKDGERWLVVTSAWHMPRAMGCFRQAGFPAIAYPVDFRTVGAEDASRPFGFLSDGLRRVDVATREWIGLLAYRVTGRTDALFPAPQARR